MPRRPRGLSDLSKDAPICLSQDHGKHVWCHEGSGSKFWLYHFPSQVGGQSPWRHTPSAGSFDVETRQQQQLV